MSEAFYVDNQDFAALRLHGYLCESGVVASVVCNECDDAHAAPVVFADGRYGHYCSDRGFVALERTELKAVHPKIAKLIDRLAEALDCKRRKGTALHGQTWRIGAVETNAGATMLYFHPRLQDECDARDLEHSLSREVRSDWRLIVTATGTLSPLGTKAVQLDDLAELDHETGDLRVLSQPAELLAVPRKNKGGRPSEHGPAMAAIISGRVQSGAALDGINSEAKAVIAEFTATHPGIPAPSLSTVKRHLGKPKIGS